MRIFFYIAALAIITALIACNTNKQDSTKQVFHESVVKADKIFKFNSVDYFWRVQDHSAENALLDNKDTREQQSAIEILYKYSPEHISDSTFIYQLEKLGYTKSIIEDNESINEISESFVFGKFSPQTMVAACGPTFRDILILRMDGEITGIAELCYGCGKIHLVRNDSLSEKDEVVKIGRLSKAIKR